MDFKDTPEEAAFRREVREFIARELPPGFGTLEFAERMATDDMSQEQRDALRQWTKKLAQRGWLTAHWPKEYGGAGLTIGEQFILNEEMAEARAPVPRGVGVMQIGPTIIVYGTEEQKREHLPGIASGEVMWCQGYSEPGAGSDLASLQTRAVRDGDDYVINGQKIWTSGAHHAQWMLLLARTDPDAPKHRGISMLLLDMKTPGITIRPLINMAGQHGFNQVFFDNVRTPVKNRVGEENRGWYVGATLLDFERSSLGSAIGLRHTVNDLLEYAREQKRSGLPLGQGAGLALELAERMVEVEIARLMSYRVVSIQKRGQIPNHEASVSKLFTSELTQRIARTGIRMIGQYGTLDKGAKWAPLQGRLGRMYISSVSSTIGGGTSEIQRNIIAGRGLGLPRD